jgi:hypothetical protein
MNKSEKIFLLTKSEFSKEHSNIFIGYGFNDSAIIFDTEGMKEYLKESRNHEQINEGRFCSVINLGSRSIVKTDKTGQELLFYFKQNNDWAISNSFFYLLNYVSSAHKLNLHKPSMLCFHLKDGTHIGEQLLSHNTMIKEIKLVPINSHIEIQHEENELSLITKPYHELFPVPANEKDYERKLIKVLENGAGLLKSIYKLNKPVNLFLSGGYDSRLVLAMMLKGIEGKSKDNLFITSHQDKVNDFQVAASLCFKLNLNLNNFLVPYIENRLSGSDALKEYLASCGGTYLPMYINAKKNLNNNYHFRLSGDQPTGWSHFEGKALFNGNAIKISEDIYNTMEARGCGDILKNEFLETFNTLGIDIHSPSAMIAYYTAIRSRFHGGRNSYKSVGSSVLFTPLMQSDFISLDLYNLANGFSAKKLFADAFSAFGDWALNEPFETPDRSFSTKLIESSPFKNGANIKPTEFNIFGSPENTEEQDPKDINLGISRYQAEPIKDILKDIFYGENGAKKRQEKTGIFTDEDFAKISKELKNRGNLSSHYRKTTHLFCVDLIYKIVEDSARSARKN